jgi:hypothetical protein
MKETTSIMQSLNESSRSAAVLYMESILTRGHTLAKFLLQRIKLQDGKVIVLTSDPLDSAEVLEFESGHFPQEVVPGTVGGLPGSISPVVDSDDQLVELIRELLGTPDSICIMENQSARADWPWLQRVKSFAVTHESEVFHLVFSKDRSQHGIADTIREARRIPVFIGAVGRITKEAAKSIQKQKTITTSDLESVAGTARLVFVGAYDGEGYVIWDG